MGFFGFAEVPELAREGPRWKEAEDLPGLGLPEAAAGSHQPCGQACAAPRPRGGAGFEEVRSGKPDWGVSAAQARSYFFHVLSCPEGDSVMRVQRRRREWRRVLKE